MSKCKENTHNDLNSKNSKNSRIDNLQIDMNGIIHPCCIPSNHYKPKDYDEMYKIIGQQLDQLVHMLMPSQLLFLSIDGVAPRAKMNQQRQRRFMSAMERQETLKNKQKVIDNQKKAGKSIPTIIEEEISNFKEEFDRSAISPGTKFMYGLSIFLKQFVDDRLQNISRYPQQKDIKIILSDHSVAGEGEHKIAAQIREIRKAPDFDEESVHCIHGADADLIMLSLSFHIKNFMIVREPLPKPQQMMCPVCGKSHELDSCEYNDPEYKKIISKQKDISDAEYKEFVRFLEASKKEVIRRDWIMIDIGVLRDYLFYEFSEIKQMSEIERQNYEKQMSQCSGVEMKLMKFQFRRIIDDFIFICFFVGNDFLPHLPYLTIREGGIDALILIQKCLVIKNKDYITNGHSINQDMLYNFIYEFSKAENDLIYEKWNKFVSSREFQKRQELDEFGVDEITNDNQDKRKRDSIEHIHFKDNENDNDNDSELNHNESQASKDIFQKKYQEYREILKEMDFNRKVHTVKLNANSIVEIDDLKLLDPSVDQKTQYQCKKFHIKEDEKDEFLPKICIEQLKGLVWVQKQYQNGCVDYEWLQTFHYAPLCSDLLFPFMKSANKESLIMQIESFDQTAIPFEPVEQLLAILPPHSSALLPDDVMEQLSQDHQFQKLIGDMIPLSFSTDQNNEMQAWMSVVLLPFMEGRRFHKVQNKLKKDLKTRNVNLDKLIVNRIGNSTITILKNGKIEKKIISVTDKYKEFDRSQKAKFTNFQNRFKCQLSSYDFQSGDRRAFNGLKIIDLVSYRLNYEVSHCKLRTDKMIESQNAIWQRLVSSHAFRRSLGSNEPLVKAENKNMINLNKFRKVRRGDQINDEDEVKKDISGIKSFKDSIKKQFL